MINIKNIKSKIKIIKLIYDSIIRKNGFLNIIDQNKIIDNHKKNNFTKGNVIDDYIIFILEEFSTNIEFYLIIFNSISENLNYTFKFINLLIKYLIDKHYYGLNNVHFILQSYKSIDTSEFLINFDKLKSALNFVGEEDRPSIRLQCIYMMLSIATIYIFPTSWFLMRVVTDVQNWVLYFFENIEESLVI